MYPGRGFARFNNRRSAMALADLSSFPDIVPIIPDSGLQFLDFGITVSREQPMPSRWGFFAEESWPLTGTELPVLAEREVAGEAADDADGGRRVTCEVELRDIRSEERRVGKEGGAGRGA